MNRLHAAILLSLFIATVGATCTPRQVSDGLGAAGTGLKVVAPFLPPPFGWILAGVGGLLGVAGSVVAGKNKTELIKQAVAAGRPVAEVMGGAGIFTKVFTERKYLLPMAGAALTVANNSLGLGLDGETITQVNTLLGVTSISEFAKDAVVSRTAKAAETKPPGA